MSLNYPARYEGLRFVICLLPFFLVYEVDGGHDVDLDEVGIMNAILDLVSVSLCVEVKLKHLDLGKGSIWS